MVVRSASRGIRSVDFFRRVPRDLTESSISGGTVSITASVVIFLLVVSQTREYLKTKTVTEVFVDRSEDGELQVNFDVSFPEISCEHLGIEVRDVIGHLKSNVTASISKLSNKYGIGEASEWDVPEWSLTNAQNDDARVKRSGWSIMSREKGHILKDDEEPEVYHSFKANSPELLEWVQDLGDSFTHFNKEDQELLKAAIALTETWAKETRWTHPKNVYGDKHAAIDVESEEQFHEIAEKYPFLIIDFHAPWCSHCRRFSPAFEEVAYLFNTALHVMQEVYQHKQFDVSRAPQASAELPKGQVAIASVNCVKQKEICDAHGITGYPSVRIVRDGQEKFEDKLTKRPVYESYSGNRSFQSVVTIILNSGSDSYLRASDSLSKLLMNKEDVPKPKRPLLALPGPEPNPDIALHSHGGCRMVGHVAGSRVPGTLRFIVSGKDVQFDPELINTAHVIHSFNFGGFQLTPEVNKMLLKYNQGSPDERNATLTWDYTKKFTPTAKRMTYEHYLKVVSTTFRWRNNAEAKLHEFTVSSNSFVHGDAANAEEDAELSQQQLPSVAFRYDLSPIQVVIKEESRGLGDFVVSLCGIIGGVYSVATMVDGLIGRAQEMARKVNLGKQG